ncbi:MULTISPECIES: ATP-dependent DNA helicase RecG [unclassified Neptuniibacter]|uniref:ATP-dependent DNA helicase RecG n=1 Tax=unclassified Neptuniibacter TaxID=2630693 RepID=UPI000C486877|nr:MULTISPECIES: ATP-dependent DNA helicase RecG [unclassified Neptuniibacter]MAY41876.1 ATP-dependent DNA helicase RecG [Oceanospirillaceae bacterium]|tara:strand:- start:1314 stop:3392 length:2079 start_codon:yes stop_codon:yes gene_type:complete
MSVSLADISVGELKGVGAALELKLHNLGVRNLQDLLFHLPLRYQDRTRIVPMGSLRPGDECVVEGEVKLADVSRGKRRSLLCRIQDGTGMITLRFFHFSASQKNNLKLGVRIRCFGEVRTGANGLEIVHPEYKRVESDDLVPVEEHLTPVYPTTEGLHQGRLRALTEQALQYLKDGALQELVPESLRQGWQFPGLDNAVAYLHRPPVDVDQHLLLEGMHPAQRRLAFEELLAHHLSLLKLRQKTRKKGAPELPGNGELKNAFLAQLPFPLTGAQSRVGDEVAKDLAQGFPMLRLVQGDVGSGKTVVAALAAIQTVESGLQAAIMAPTEILAEQHYINFTQWLEPLDVKVAWLAGKLKGKARKEQLELIRSGEARVVVGTHALFQEEVVFSDLGLAVIDEQHRFGVHQRLSLREKGRNGELAPHQLIMTATPIPRTLTMSAYADLDCSIIDELPPGRTPVNTVVIADTRRDEVIQRVRNACKDKRQVYWVCTLIEESEALQCQAAEVTEQALRETLPELNIGLVHGRMKPAEKAELMRQFKAAELDLLVATTVIEVGVDVPNASVMIIENPERLGLAQLHQLRGRVGRGSVESFCVLMYQAPLSKQGRERLSVMRETTDGFRIAEKDLELRGPGEVLGTRQTGVMQFKMADLQRDSDLLTRVKSVASQMQEWPDFADSLVERWLGRGEDYGNV